MVYRKRKWYLKYKFVFYGAISVKQDKKQKGVNEMRRSEWHLENEVRNYGSAKKNPEYYLNFTFIQNFKY